MACTLKGHLTAVSCLAPQLEKRCNYVVSGSNDTNVKLWDLRQKNCMHTFKGHSKPVLCVAMSPDSQLIASGAADGNIK